MKLNTIVSAAASLQKIVAQDLPLRSAFELSHLIDTLNPCLEFYGREFLKAAAAKDSEGAVAELLDFEANVELPRKVSLPLDLPLMLTPADIKFLTPFVEFVEKEAAS